MESTLTDSVPQLTINRPDRDMFLSQLRHKKARSIQPPEKINYTQNLNLPIATFESETMEGYTSAGDEMKYENAVKKAEVEALAAIGVQFGDEPSLMDRLQEFKTSSTRDLQTLHGKSFDGENVQKALEINKAIEIAKKTFQYDGISGTAILNNSIGDPEAKSGLMQESIFSGFINNGDTYAIALKRKRGDIESDLEIEIVLGEPDEDIPYKKSTHSGSGEFENISFSSATDAIQTSFNSAALKFKADVLHVQQATQKLISSSS